MDKNGIYLQLYKRAAAPNRDYYGLTITKNDVVLNIWNITHGPHVFPKKHKCPLPDFPTDRNFKAEIEQLFGKHVVDYCEKLSRNDPKLECLPTKVFLYILRHLATNDILNLGQTSKLFFELCNSDSSWKLLFKKRVKKRSSFDDLENPNVRGWRNMLMTKILLQETHVKTKIEKTNKSRFTNKEENSRRTKKVSFHLEKEGKRSDFNKNILTGLKSREDFKMDETQSETNWKIGINFENLMKETRNSLECKQFGINLENQRIRENPYKQALIRILPDSKKIPLNQTQTAEKKVNQQTQANETKDLNDKKQERKMMERNNQKHEMHFLKYGNKIKEIYQEKQDAHFHKYGKQVQEIYHAKQEANVHKQGKQVKDINREKQEEHFHKHRKQVKEIYNAKQEANVHKQGKQVKDINREKQEANAHKQGNQVKETHNQKHANRTKHSNDQKQEIKIKEWNYETQESKIKEWNYEKPESKIKEWNYQKQKTHLHKEGNPINEINYEIQEVNFHKLGNQIKERNYQFDERNFQSRDSGINSKTDDRDTLLKNPFQIPDSFYDHLPKLKKPQKLFKPFTIASSKIKSEINLNNAKIVNEFKDVANNKSNLLQSKSNVSIINNKGDFKEEILSAKKEKNVNLKSGGSLRKGKGFSVKFK